MKLNLEFAFAFAPSQVSKKEARQLLVANLCTFYFLFLFTFYSWWRSKNVKYDVWWNISNVKITKMYVCELYDHHQYPWEAPQWGTASNIAFAWHLSLVDFKTTIWNNLYRGLDGIIRNIPMGYIGGLSTGSKCSFSEQSVGNAKIGASTVSRMY